MGVVLIINEIKWGWWGSLGRSEAAWDAAIVAEPHLGFPWLQNPSLLRELGVQVLHRNRGRSPCHGRGLGLDDLKSP